MKNIIVAGASGFIGSNLVKRLIKENVHVWAVDRSFKEGILPKSDTMTMLDNVHDLSELKELIPKNEIDAFYNFAWRGVNGFEKANYEIQLNNILLLLKYAELAHDLKCKKYLCAGTIAERAIDSLPLLKKTSTGMMYSAAKSCGHIMLETYCKKVGLNYVWMQFSNIYGPTNKTGNLISYTIDQLKNGNPAIFGPALQPYDFLYVDDLIEAIYRLGVNRTRDNFYYIGSGEPRILKEYLISIGRIYEKQDLIHIGERDDDGIRYTFEMMDNSKIKNEIGDYVSGTFENHIRFTIDNF